MGWIVQKIRAVFFAKWNHNTGLPWVPTFCPRLQEPWALSQQDMNSLSVARVCEIQELEILASLCIMYKKFQGPSWLQNIGRNMCFYWFQLLFMKSWGWASQFWMLISKAEFVCLLSMHLTNWCSLRKHFFPRDLLPWSPELSADSSFGACGQEQWQLSAGPPVQAPAHPVIWRLSYF